MLTLHVAPVVLWRETDTYCECACVSSQWAVRLYAGGLTVKEYVGEHLAPLLRLSQQWRRRAAGSGADVAREPGRPPGDRRRITRDRRASTRGGRRHKELYRSDRYMAALLTELAKLRMENQQLRQAALTFGALAERLNMRTRP